MSPPIVRFAPSPTGKLHVGNVRTALINWLFASANDGKFILRIDDTDQERSTKAYEDGLKADLKWLGLEWAETFNQSDRFDLYDAAAEKLKAEGLLYACYETADELDRQRKLARATGKPPTYNRAALSLTDDQKAAYEAEGRRPHWRFKLSGNRLTFVDLIRGEQIVDTASLSDPVLIREDGGYLYTLPSCVDDIDANITHVVRGEDHVTNSGVQIEIFEALCGQVPQMAHTPLIVWKDGSAIGKRLGSLGMSDFREMGIEPISIASLLATMGMSGSIGLGESLQALASEFSFDRISRAPARFDDDELKNLNATLLNDMPFEAAKDRLEAIDPRMIETPLFWETIRTNCTVVPDAANFIPVVYGDIDPIIDDEDRAFITTAASLLPETEFGEGAWSEWTKVLKAETDRKGRKLFMPLRKAITGMEHGPDMGAMLRLIGREKVVQRLA